jgi:ABC-type protease/lipase transport system fused ATPase/permease subunit|tara:strand:- start:29 stop:244 length:216 start_codon:yes stop_codon:yes gene_type:complete
MLSIVGNIIGFITKVVPMLFAYRAGKKSAQVDILENESEMVEKANEVERNIDRIHSDAVSEQLRKRWSQPK